MPTKNPRINLSVPPDLYDLIQRLGKVSGKSMSAAIVEMLEEGRPVLERVVVVGEAARKLQDDAKGAFRAKVEETEASIESHLQAAIGQADMFLSGLEQKVQQAQKAARAQTDAAVGGAVARKPSSTRETTKQKRARMTKYLKRRTHAKPK